MSIDFGSLADWFSAVGGIGAAVAAMVAWRQMERMLSVEEKRDRAKEEFLEREQASSIFVVGAYLPDRPSGEDFAIRFYNGSSKPISNVTVKSQLANGKVQNKDLELGLLPPGNFIVPVNKKYIWGTLVELALAPEKVEPYVKGQGSKMIVSVDFTDFKGQNWTLDGGTKLIPRS